MICISIGCLAWQSSHVVWSSVRVILSSPLSLVHKCSDYHLSPGTHPQISSQGKGWEESRAHSMNRGMGLDSGAKQEGKRAQWEGETEPWEINLESPTCCFAFLPLAHHNLPWVGNPHPPGITGLRPENILGEFSLEENSGESSGPSVIAGMEDIPRQRKHWQRKRKEWHIWGNA